MTDVITLLAAGTGASVTGATHDTGDLKNGAVIQVVAAGSAAAWTVELDGSLDGTNWVQLPLVPITAGVLGSAGATVGASTLGVFAAAMQAGAGMWRYFRAKSGANTTVTVSALLGFSDF
jgi:hypothetical protein